MGLADGDDKKEEKSTGNLGKEDDDVPDAASDRKEESNFTNPQNYQQTVRSRQSESSAPARQSSSSQNFSRNNLQPSNGIGNTKASDETKTQPPTRSQILSERAVKIREARERYFKRHGLPSQ